MITGIGKSLFHWANYICDVNRHGIVNEGSIKYAISEFLEVSKSGIPTPNRENIAVMNKESIKSYQFEYPHPHFVKRLIDLHVECCKGNEKIDNFLEFKYTRNANMSSEESDRYVDDIYRLYSLKKSNADSRCYFVLLTTLWHFPYWVDKLTQRIQIVKDTSKKINNDILNVLKFDRLEATKSFRPNVLDRNLKSFYLDYKKNKNYKKGLSDKDKIKTKLIYSSYLPKKNKRDEIYHVFIWEIK